MGSYTIRLQWIDVGRSGRGKDQIVVEISLVGLEIEGLAVIGDARSRYDNRLLCMRNAR
jgi:hypothetical protein